MRVMSWLRGVCLAWLAMTMPAHARLDEAEALAVLTAQPQAEEAAWQALAGQGLPIIEPHPGDDSLARVTFAYRGHDGVSEVRLDSVINAPLAADYVDDYREDFTLPLSRLNGSDLWTITLDVERDVQASYSFLVSELSGVYRRSDPANRRQLRGEDAESLLVMDQVTGRDMLRPFPPSQRRQALARAFESEALGRPVFLQLFPAEREDAPLLVLYDSFLWGVRAPAWEILQNLENAGHIPDMHLILVDQLDASSAGHAYADQTVFIVDELLPIMARQAGIRPSASDIILAGASRRGLAASIVALERPDAIGAVISLSGSFYWAPDSEAPEWLARELEPAGLSAPRFVLAAGELEYVHTSTNRGHVMLDTNRNMARRLGEQGYQVDLQIFPGGHDVAAWRSALASGLVTLFADEGG